MDIGKREEKVRCIERVTWKLTLSFVKIDVTTEICCMAHETQTGSLYQPRGMGWARRWEGGSKERGYTCTYG